MVSQFHGWFLHVQHQAQPGAATVVSANSPSTPRPRDPRGITAAVLSSHSSQPQTDKPTAKSSAVAAFKIAFCDFLQHECSVTQLQENWHLLNTKLGTNLLVSLCLPVEQGLGALHIRHGKLNNFTADLGSQLLQ